MYKKQLEILLPNGVDCISDKYNPFKSYLIKYGPEKRDKMSSFPRVNSILTRKISVFVRI